MNEMDFIIKFGKAANEMKSPMTMGEALDIVDPFVRVESPEDHEIAIAKEIKAKAMVVKFARAKLSEDTKNGRKDH